MKKSEFIDAIKPVLKNDGYRKKGSYWYQQNGELLLCINVQGSQWDKNDYYVNIGIAMFDSGDYYLFPTLLHWKIVHRCFGRTGQLNIEPHELFTEVEKHLSISNTSDLPQYLKERNASQVANQLWF